jgi:hypothetical protein
MPKTIGLPNMRYIAITAAVLVLILANVIFYAGIKPDQPLTLESVAPSCALVNENSGDNEHHFKCGLTKEELAAYPVIDDSMFSAGNNCRVELTKDGFIDSIYCNKDFEKSKSLSFKDPVYKGDWLCTGLDGFGGASEHYIAKLSILTKDKFNIHLSAKKNTDSIWHIKDSVISGRYNHGDNNEVIFIPESWESDLINLSELTLDDAPNYMPVNAFEIKVNLLKGDVFNASHRIVGRDTALRDLQCSKIN